MKATPIAQPAPAERILDVVPPLSINVDPTWLRHLHLYTGRSLSDVALTVQQQERAGHLALHGRAIAPGIVSGLQVGMETTGAGSFLRVSPGFGLAASGEDVHVLQPIRAPLGGIRVYGPVAMVTGAADGAGADNPATITTGTLLARTLGKPFGQIQSVAGVPPVAIVVLQPMTLPTSGADTGPNQCTPDPQANAFEDWQLLDGCRLLLYLWPSEWLPLPPSDGRWRNRLAYTIFDVEMRQDTASAEWAAPPDGTTWPAAALPHRVLPWEEVGVPIGLVAFDNSWKPLFIDQWSVARPGGGRADRVPWYPGRGTPSLWQARFRQFGDQVADAGQSTMTISDLSGQFRYVPPLGILPVSAMDLQRDRDEFFPSYYADSAGPVPLEQLDLVMRESIALAPYDLFTPDQVEILVPVPQVWYEPNLLKQEQPDPAFASALEEFSEQRADWLQRREDVRAKASALSETITGTAATYPTPDPEALPDETSPPSFTFPFAGNRVHLSTSNAPNHDVTGIGPEAIGRTDTLFAYVYLDPANTPTQLTVSWTANAQSWMFNAVWGTNLADGAQNAVAMGPIPAAGQWTRLEVPASTFSLGIDVRTLNGIAFSVSGGNAAWGKAGSYSSGADPSIWLSDAIPSGASVDGTWVWGDLSVVPYPPEGTFGLTWTPTPGVMPMLGETPGSWVPDAMTAVENALQDPSLVGNERDHLHQVGLAQFIQDLQAIANSADDAINFGFLQVQTDIYRMRQIMLGNVAGTRLATSPTLASIAQGDSAVATRDDLKTYFAQAKGAMVGPAQPSAPSNASPAPAAPSAPAAQPAASRVSQLGLNRFTVGSLEAARTFSAAESSQASMTMVQPEVVQPILTVQPSFVVSPVVSPVISRGISPIGTISGATTGTFVAGGLGGATVVSQLPVGTILGAASAPARLAGLAAGAVSAVDITAQSPVVGQAYDFRTTTVADRLDNPAGPEAMTYASANRHDVVSQFSDLTSPSDGSLSLSLKNVPVHGVAVFDNAGQPKRDPVTQDAVREDILFQNVNSDVLGRILSEPNPINGDEAHFLAVGVKVADFAIATLRGIEGRVAFYRQLIATCQTALNTLQSSLGDANSRLIALQSGLAQARHDLASARGLNDDEVARVKGINDRRSQILAEHVPFLAYRRPRLADLLVDMPARDLDPDVQVAVVPLCSGQTITIPPEIRTLVNLLRETPITWFPLFRGLLDRLDRVDALQTVLQTAAVRAASIPDVNLSAAGKLGQSINDVLQGRRRMIVQARQPATEWDMSSVNTLTWQQTRNVAAQLVSLGDLIGAPHGYTGVVSQGTQNLDQITQVAGCLYMHLSDVLPAIRLAWAEDLNAYGATINLRNLSALPRWMQLSYVERATMQTLVDWLYQQVDPLLPQATGLMDDIVRVCILLASHSPVGQIVAGRVQEPTPVQIGGRVPIVVDPGLVRIGMPVLLYEGQTVAAHAVVDDLGQGQVAARVVQMNADRLQLAKDTVVHFTDLPMTQ